MASKSGYMVHVIFISFLCHQPSSGAEEGYLRYVKDGCFLRGEAMSCIKYKALKLAKKTLFGGNNSNETIRANHMISFVPLDAQSIGEYPTEDVDLSVNEPRGFFSEWTELTKYAVKLIKDFFRARGLKVVLPDGARTIDDEESLEEEGRGKRKRLAILVPLLTLLAALKTKLLLIPVLLAVLLIKKLLLLAALLIPSLLHTLKTCKVHHPMHSYFGSSDVSDVNTAYGNAYSYSSGAGYGKDWASNRAYTMPKIRQTPSPVYMTAPGAAT